MTIGCRKNKDFLSISIHTQLYIYNYRTEYMFMCICVFLTLMIFWSSLKTFYILSFIFSIRYIEIFNSSDLKFYEQIEPFTIILTVKFLRLQDDQLQDRHRGTSLNQKYPNCKSRNAPIGISRNTSKH